MSADKLIDAFIGLFGRARMKLGDWPRRASVDAYVRLVEEAGGTIVSTSGSPDGSFEVIVFRFRGRRIRLCWEEFGEVSVWGPKHLVAELADRVAAQGLATAASRSKNDCQQPAG